MLNSASASVVSVNGPSWKFIKTVLGLDSQDNSSAGKFGRTGNSFRFVKTVDISFLFFERIQLNELRRSIQRPGRAGLVHLPESVDDHPTLSQSIKDTSMSTG